jgi:hypothetical protein
MVRPARGRVPRWLTGRYTGLTIVLLVLSVSSIAIGRSDLRKVIDGIAFTALLVLAIWIVGQRLRVATVALVVPTLISHWIDHLSPPMPDPRYLVSAPDMSRNS